MPNVRVYASQSPTDLRGASVLNHGHVDERAMAEVLFGIGQEFKTADYFPSRQVVIVIDPDEQVNDEGLTQQQTEVLRLRAALIASGVKEGLVDAIQNGDSVRIA